MIAAARNHCRRQTHHIVRLRLNPEGLFLCSMLQLQMRLQVGLGIDELY